jgi:hypothetical protein
MSTSTRHRQDTAMLSSLIQTVFQYRQANLQGAEPLDVQDEAANDDELCHGGWLGSSLELHQGLVVRELAAMDTCADWELLLAA